jgi:phosphoglycolate phosphatase-like HAD superfamily hydrolase
MTQFALFDLDNTLVDSNHLKPLRDARDWREVYTKVSTVALFDGIGAMWQTLRKRGMYLGIVTHSPRSYAQRVIDHVGLQPDALIAYHDLSGNKKPSPFGYKQCAGGRSADCGIAVGDERADLLAADAFGCPAIFAGWSLSPVVTEKQCAEAGWVFATNPAAVIEAVRVMKR